MYSPVKRPLSLPLPNLMYALACFGAYGAWVFAPAGLLWGWPRRIVAPHAQALFVLALLIASKGDLSQALPWFVALLTLNLMTNQLPAGDSFVISGLALAVTGLVMWDSLRMRGATGSPNVFAIYMAILFLSGGGYTRMVGGLALLLSGSLGGLLAAAVGSLAKWPKYRWVTLVVFVVGVVVVSMARPHTLTDLHHYRLSYWGVAWQMFTSSPLFGHGLGSFVSFWTTAYPLEYPHLTAHNLWLNILGEGGLSLFLPFCWLLVELFRRSSPARVPLLLALAIHCMVDVPEPGVLLLCACVLAPEGESNNV